VRPHRLLGLRSAVSHDLRSCPFASRRRVVTLTLSPAQSCLLCNGHMEAGIGKSNSRFGSKYPCPAVQLIPRWRCRGLFLLASLGWLPELFANPLTPSAQQQARPFVGAAANEAFTLEETGINNFLLREATDHRL
jgi:hypothetical protein